MALMVSMLLLVCAGRSEDTVTREPRRPTNSTIEKHCAFSYWLDLSGRANVDTRFSLLVFNLDGKSLQLVTPVEFADFLRIFPPIWRDFNKQSEVNLTGED